MKKDIGKRRICNRRVTFIGVSEVYRKTSKLCVTVCECISPCTIAGNVSAQVAVELTRPVLQYCPRPICKYCCI